VFIGFIISVVIIIAYAMYVKQTYARKSDLEELKQKLSELEGGKDDSSSETD